MKKLISVFIMLSMISVLGLVNISPVYAQSFIYVSRDQATATPGYYCDGIDDQEQIDDAIEFVAANSSYSHVCLLDGTYNISRPITMLGRTASNPVYLGGGSNTIVRIADGVIWNEFESMIQGTGQTGIVISGFVMDGNRDNVTRGIDENNNEVDAGDGKDFYNCIYLKNCNNISISYMNLRNNRNDGLRANGCSSIVFERNTVAVYHDGFYGYGCQNVEVRNNTFEVRINNAIRVDNSNHATFSYNNITGVGGGAGIQVQKANGNICDDINITYNTITNTLQSGIWVFGSVTTQGSSYGAAKVNIWYNNIIGCGTRTSVPAQGAVGGIVIAGFNADIFYNKIHGCYGWALATMDRYVKYDPPMNMTFTLNLNFNEMLNILPHLQSNNTTYAIYNELNQNTAYDFWRNYFTTDRDHTYFNLTPPDPDPNIYNYIP